MARLAGLLLLCLALALIGAGRGSAQNATVQALETEAERLNDAGDGASRERAIGLFRQALDQGSLTAAYKLARALDERGAAGDLQSALDLLHRTQPAFEAAYGANGEETARFLMTLGFVSSDAGLTREALAATQRAKEIVDGIGKYDRWSAQLDINIGIYLEDLGQYPEALASFSRALPVFEKAYGRDDPRTGGVHNNAAIVYESMSDYPAALKQYRESLRIVLKTSGPNSLEAAQLYDNIGGVLDRQGKSAEGLALFEKATPIFVAAYGANHPAVGRHLADMATLYNSLDRYPEALAKYDEALPMLIAGFGENSKFVAAVNYNRANTLTQLGRGEDSLRDYQKAYDANVVLYGADSPEAVGIQVEMGGAMADLGRAAEAVKLYEKAVPVYEKTFGANGFRTGLLYNNLGIANVSLGRYEAATAAYRRSLAIRQTLYGSADPQVADIMVNMARSLALAGQPDQALALDVEALAIYAQDPAKNLGPLRKNYLSLAERLKDMGRRRAATLFAKLAVNAHQDLRLQNAALPPAFAQSLARTMKPAYDLLVAQQIADGAFSDAQFAGTLMKEAELVAFTRGGVGDTPKADARARLTKQESAFAADLMKIVAAPARTAQRLQSLYDGKGGKRGSEQAIADGQRRFAAAMDPALAAAKALFDKIEAEGAATQKAELENNAKTAAALQTTLSGLGSGVALYQAIALDDGLHLFVSAGGRETVHREVKIVRADLARKVYDTVSAIEGRDPDALARLRDLYGVLIAPVADDLGALKPRVLMLDLSGFLRYVPYAALNSGQRYLIEDYALALYSPAVATKFGRPAVADNSGAGFGVTKGFAGFAPLPGAAAELEAIFTGTDHAGPVDGQPVLDGAFDAASLKAALQRKPRYVHVASHFKFEPGNESQSFLLLGNGAALSMAALRSDKALRFDGVDLLTLSACETARGGGSEGEEVESFGALAQSDGASAVMATLWQIADQSTARLMADFYDGRVRLGLDKATALQRAQIAMLRGAPAGPMVATRGSRGVTPVEEASAADAMPASGHPYYWAAFILMGNWM